VRRHATATHHHRCMSAAARSQTRGSCAAHQPHMSAVSKHPSSPLPLLSPLSLPSAPPLPPAADAGVPQALHVAWIEQQRVKLTRGSGATCKASRLQHRMWLKRKPGHRSESHPRSHLARAQHRRRGGRTRASRVCVRDQRRTHARVLICTGRRPPCRRHHQLRRRQVYGRAQGQRQGRAHAAACLRRKGG
jgi:hypothetical protein